MSAVFDPKTSVDFMVVHNPLGLRIRRYKAGPKGMELDGYEVIDAKDHPILFGELEKLLIQMDEHKT